MVDRYPFLVTVPHGGLEVDAWVAGRLLLTSDDLVRLADPATTELYDFGERVAAWSAMTLSRMIVDVNRSPFDLPPRRQDGVVKVRTIDGRPVYRPGEEPSIDLVHGLMMQHYFPYHERIDHLIDTRDVRIAFDCHTMLGFGPRHAPDPGRRRPLVCLGNHGDDTGAPRARQLATCPSSWLRRLANAFEEEFAAGTVAINRPYAGGFTTIAHYWHRGVPYIQVELNRSLYESPEGMIDCRRVEEVRERVWGAFVAFWNEIEEG